MSADGYDLAASSLLALLASPPCGTSGQRTLARVSMAAALIGCTDYQVSNVFAEPTPDVLAITSVGATAHHWKTARDALEPLIEKADHVLFAWGKTEPSGPARDFHRAQVEWIISQASSVEAVIWMVGAEPRHPSRWQRYTAREHAQLPFREALGHALRIVSPAELEKQMKVKNRNLRYD